MEAQQTHYRLIRLYVEKGSIVCRYYDAAVARAAIVWLGGVGGGFDSPARDLFDRMAVELLGKQVSSLRIRYRYSHDLSSCVEDALIGLEFLGTRGIREAVTVGHSFGGAVAIQAGAESLLATGAVGLASQSFGTSRANRLSPRPLLLIHGENDQVMPPECAVLIYDRALEPKQLIIIPGAGHCFDEAANELQEGLREWLTKQLRLVD